MDAMRRCAHLIIRAVGPSLQVINARRRALSERFSFGIASRQAAAFICVGVLVLAANFIIEQGVLIERTTEITRIAPPAIAPKPTPQVSELPSAVIPERFVVASETLM